MDIKKYMITKGSDFKLSEHDPQDTGPLKDKEEGKLLMAKNIEKLQELQDKLYAQNEFALLLIFQAMDAAGKDGTIKHVMRGINPQGSQVFSFKQPSSEELDHDYMWRCMKRVPERGRIGIFNRSYYEDVLVARVHNLVPQTQLPKKLITKNIWNERFEQIKNYETYLRNNGIIPIKFFLNISKEEQKERFLERIEDPAKNWKFSMGDINERSFWNDYQKYYEEAIQNTATKDAPWYVIPADHKWFMRALVSSIIVDTLEQLNLQYPSLSDEALAELELAREQLLNEDGAE